MGCSIVTQMCLLKSNSGECVHTKLKLKILNVTYKLILSSFIHLRIIMIRRVIWFNWNESNPSSTRSRPGCTWWLQKVCWWFFHSIPYLIINGQAGNAYKLSVQLCQSTFTLTLWCKIWLNQNFVVQLSLG